MTYSSIEWLPLAVGLTVLGLVLSYLAYKRSGARAGLRGTAWSLLPIAAYLTGAIEMLWKIGAAIGQFGSGFVFSPAKWAGVGVTGLALVFFLASGGRLRRKVDREARKAARADRKNAATGPAGTRAGVAGTDPAKTAATRALATTQTPAPAAGKTTAAPAKPSRKAAAKAAADDNDDLKDIEEILRKRGI